MKKIAIAISATLAATVLAFAGPVEDREALMKERGGLTGQIAKVAKGETPFDAAAVLDTLTKMQANANKAVTDIDALWPAGSEGGETNPKVFVDMAGFKAENEKFKALVDAAVAAPPADVAGVQAALGPIGKQCVACHELYRIEK